MKRKVLVALVAITLFSCKKEENMENTEQKIQVPVKPATNNKTSSTEINWNEIPDLQNIGHFPFITAPAGLKVAHEKDGISEFFDYETMENYIGNSIYTSEGKLGILAFEGAEGKDFNQKLFDKSMYDYLDKTGAKKIYQGDFPEDENQREKLEKNMWTGKHGTSGLLRESDAPFAVYAFKNAGKKYIVNIQSNSAQGNVFIMELKDFEQTIKKYSAEQMKIDIDKTGKAILHINFATDKATLQPDGEKIITEIFGLLNANPNLKLSIEGHTDNTGTAAKNQKLSSDRANTVMYALAAKGIDIKRLKAAGFGSEKPLKENNTEENKAENRRVELVKI